jgi:methionyl-tRNA formyltransferase
MDIVFCGTPQFAVSTLAELVAAGFNVRLVVSQPDRPRGRGMETAITPVKELAVSLGLEVVQPEAIKQNDDFREQLESVKPVAIVVVAYGRIIPRWMIDLPPLGNINLHASLLPKYRGAAPIQWAIANGDSVTGVTTMRIEEGLDTGDLLLQKEIPIGNEDTSVTLAPRMADIGAHLMVETLRGLEAGSVKARPQDHKRATVARLLKKEDGKIDFARPAAEIFNRLRGFQPWPGAYTSFRGKNLNLWAARPMSDRRQVPSRELMVEDERLLMGCGDGSVLEVIELQVEGKKRMTARDFIHGYRPVSGEKLGTE